MYPTITLLLSSFAFGLITGLDIVPAISIAWPSINVVSKAVSNHQLRKVALVGNKPVMEDDFFTACLRNAFDIQIVVPEADRRIEIHHEIMGDLSRKVVTPYCKRMLSSTIEGMVAEGAQGVVFACTELQFAVQAEDLAVPLWVSMDAHIAKAIKFDLSD